MFSIILATLNRSYEVEEAVESILRQKDVIYEIIIIDQSEDKKTLNILEEKIRKYKNIKYYNVKFKGLSKARNFGINKANYKYICLMDDDAKYQENFLEKAKKHLEDSKYDIISGKILDFETNQVFNPEMEIVDELDINLNNIDICCSASIVANKEKLKIENINFDENLGVGTKFGAGEETDFLIKAISKNLKVKYTKELIVYHPYPVNNFNENDLKRAYTYGLGEGGLCKKYILNKNMRYMFLFRFMKRIIKTTIAVLIYSLKKEKRQFYIQRLKGLVRGVFEFRGIK